jgi:SAM-dependent methyltransferase
MHADTGVVIADRVEPDDGQFDALLSCEVLEHIDDDVGALRSWVSSLRPGGLAVLSVPAHPAWFGPHDVWAGHVRRYTKSAFVKLAEAAGLSVERVECYGFPVANVTMVARTAVTLLKRERTMSVAASTARSGVDRSVESRLFPAQLSLPGRLALRAALVAQEQFLQTPLGEGYLLVARRR